MALSESALFQSNNIASYKRSYRKKQSLEFLDGWAAVLTKIVRYAIWMRWVNRRVRYHRGDQERLYVKQQSRIHYRK
uniref:Transposase n=1 Tax=Steinernema glaseri TaxID=37863 RepID=A0A1I7XYC3_9BILA